MKEYAKAFYKGKQWKKISRLYMEQQHYICEDNLEALCQECHNKEHFQKYNTAIFDANGNMTGVKESAELEEYKEAIEELERIKKGRVESP